MKILMSLVFFPCCQFIDTFLFNFSDIRFVGATQIRYLVATVQYAGLQYDVVVALPVPFSKIYLTLSSIRVIKPLQPGYNVKIFAMRALLPLDHFNFCTHVRP